MEFLKHGDLQKFLGQPFTELETHQIAFQLVEGLVFMHENGFTHRDLKPGVCHNSYMK
jgi:calcium/calmodulin-dependent protein kinase I